MNQQELTEFLFKHRDNLETKQTLMFDNVGRKLQLSINNLHKKTKGIWSDATSHYTVVSSLHPISKQNTRKKEEEDLPAEQGNKKNMRQSQPGSNNIINY